RISPFARYLFMPAVDQTENPIFDELDRMRKRNLVVYGLENEGNWLGESQPGNVRLGIFRQYALDATSDPHSPLFGRLQMRFPMGIGLSATEDCDPRAKKYKNYHGVYRAEGAAFGLFFGVEFHRLTNYELNDQTRVLVDEEIDS